MYKLILAKVAAQELEEELAYSARIWGSKHALLYAKEIRQKLKNLRSNPFLYPVGETQGNLRVISYKGIQIVYLIEKEEKRVIVYGFVNIHRDSSMVVSRIKKN